MMPNGRKPEPWLTELAYRRPLRVRELMVCAGGRPEDSYYVCPRCRVTMEREFMQYCDRCGQCLDWSRYTQVKIIRTG